MGQQQHRFTSHTDISKKPKKTIPEEYKVFYQKWSADPDYFTNLLQENPTLTQNIINYFPGARNSYEQFLQMVFYLRSYDPIIEKSQYAKYNLNETTLLDRFFMIVMRIGRFQQLTTTIINKNQMEDLFIELMKIFMEKPKKGFIHKLCKYIGLKDVEKLSIKQYSSSLREFLPHIQKHIKDYYKSKFKDMQKNGHLLKYFDSEILVEDAVLLSMKVNQLTNPSIQLLYQPRSCGSSFYFIQKCILGYTGPWLLVVEHQQTNKYQFDNFSEGKKIPCRFGSYQSGPILDVSEFQGDFKGFLFETQPKLKLYFTENGQGGEFYFYLNSHRKKQSKLRKGIGFGGNQHKQKFKLWIDENLQKSTVFNGNDKTYGFGSIVNPSTTNLRISKIQIWGLGTEEDMENHRVYWQQRSLEIQKRRKVNRAQFVDEMEPRIMFETTFGYSDQVSGQKQTIRKIRKQSQSYKPETFKEPKRRRKYTESPPSLKKILEEIKPMEPGFIQSPQKMRKVVKEKQNQVNVLTYSDTGYTRGFLRADRI